MELAGCEHRISAESIYRHAYIPAGWRAGLPRLLAQRKPKRGQRRRNDRRERTLELVRQLSENLYGERAKVRP